MRRSRPCRVVFDGQSRVNVPPWTGHAILGFSWPRILMAGRGIPAYDKPAIGGTSLTSLASTFNTRCAPWIAPASLEPTIYVLCGGFTDYFGEGNTGAQVYADAWALTDLARGAGAVYCICTTTLGCTAGSWTAGMETQRLAGNALILGDASNKFDASVDLEVPGLDDPDDGEAYFDQLHIYGWPAIYGITDHLKGTQRAAYAVQPYLEAAIAAVTA